MDYTLAYYISINSSTNGSTLDYYVSTGVIFNGISLMGFIHSDRMDLVKHLIDVYKIRVDETVIINAYTTNTSMLYYLSTKFISTSYKHSLMMVSMIYDRCSEDKNLNLRDTNTNIIGNNYVSKLLKDKIHRNFIIEESIVYKTMILSDQKITKQHRSGYYLFFSNDKHYLNVLRMMR